MTKGKSADSRALYVYITIDKEWLIYNGPELLADNRKKAFKLL